MKTLTVDSFGRTIRYEVLEQTRTVEVVNPDGAVALTLKFPSDKSTTDILATIASMKTTIDPIDVRRETARATVNAVRDSRLVSPVEFGGARFDCDMESQLKIAGVIALVSAGIPLPADFVWRDADNINRLMTAQSMVNLGATLMQQQDAIFKRSWALKAEIAASDHPELIDINGGWPA